MPIYDPFPLGAKGRARPPLVTNLLTASDNMLSGGDPTNGKWVNGITVGDDSEKGTINWTLTEACVVHSAGDIPAPTHLTPQQWAASVIETFEKCSAFGFASTEYRARAQRRLEAITPVALATELWQGLNAQANSWPNNYLAKDVGGDLTTPAGTTAIGYRDALAELQAAIANAQGFDRGMIHANVRSVSRWFADGSLHRAGPVLLDEFENVVVASPGYNGSGTGHAGINESTGALRASAWAYATGIVGYLIDTPVTDPPTDDMAAMLIRRSNDIAALAWRNGLAFFEPGLHAGVFVDHDSEL